MPANQVCLRGLSLAALLGGLFLLSDPARGQMTPEQAAEMLLNSARKGYNEKNYPFAITRFREFLAKYPNHKDTGAARYGLALALLDAPEKDYTAALEPLQQLAGVKDSPEHPFVLYYLGLAQRGLGIRELAQATAKPAEAPQRRTAAQQRFEEAGKQFGLALAAFTARAKPPAADAKELPADLEWAASARCDQAEMQLRTQKAKEAQATAAPFTTDPVLSKSRYHGLGLYYHGFASFLLNDHAAAGRSLSQPPAFTHPVFGTHARYLLARVHHLGEEHAEAARHYEGTLADFAKNKQAAVEALKRPDLLKNDPEEKARLEALVNQPPPEHIARAAFYAGVLLYEAGRFADAAARFATFTQQNPNLPADSPLPAEAQLRLGFCQVQLKDFATALKTLTPLVDREPRLADQTLLWIGKAQTGAADPANAAAHDQALKTAIDSFKRAADRSQQLVKTDPEANARRGEALLEMADAQQLVKLYKEAAATYGQVIGEKLLPQREEELLQRQITAVHLAGDYTASDQLCDRFQQTYPKSPLLPAVLFRRAENSYFSWLNADKIPDANTRKNEQTRIGDETAKRYQAVIEKFPEYPQVNLARYGLGLVQYRKGEFEKARQAWEGIPQPDRAGALALAPYLIADCLIRLAPASADDALAAGQLQEQLQGAAEQLSSFIGSQPNAPQTPDALVKLGLCYQRLAALLAQPPERAKVLQAARTQYETVIQKFPQHALVPQATAERAKCQAQMGDKNGAINELRRFTTDPLRNAAVAPMAVIHLSVLLREQNKGEEAAKLLADCRQQQEPSLMKDPERQHWVALLLYHQGACLREAGKLAEARPVLEQVMKQFASRPEAAEAALRWGQCLQQESLQKIDAARKRLATPNLKPEEIGAANKALDEARKGLRDAAQHFETQAEQLKARQPVPDLRGRFLYEGAWAYRTLAEPEVAAARLKMQQDLLKKLQDEAAKKSPTGKPPAIVAAPEVPLSAVPLQADEVKARNLYQALIAGFSDLPLASDARFELAELHAQRDELDPAIKLLNDALDKEPPADLTDKIRLRLGDCYLARKDFKAALGQFDAVAANPKSPLLAQAHYRAGECLLSMDDPAGAAKRLAIFRDQGPFQNVPGVTDRALLRLGHALAKQGQWDPSRQAFEQIPARFGNSPWLHEARYNIGWAWQNQKQFDNAVAAYTQVSAATATEIGARAQLQIGLCRLEQKRYPEAATALLVVPFTYDYPELNALALCEAARAFTELKQPEQAERLLQRVLKEHPESKLAEVAKERLKALKGS